MAARKGGEKRGNSTDRWNRRVNLARWWADMFGIVRCVYCECELRACTPDEVREHQAEHGQGTHPADMIVADRIDPGGPYRMSNLVPSCGECNRHWAAVPFRFRFAATARARALREHAAAYKRAPRSR